MGSLDVQLPLGSFINLWTLLVGNICLIGINLDAFGETQKESTLLEFLDFQLLVTQVAGCHKILIFWYSEWVCCKYL